MKIAVIAAQGRSGKAFVEAALAAGHEVRAGVRGEHGFAPNAKLATVECDATNESQVKELLRGCDAVVSLLGHVKGSAPDVQTRAIATIVAAMRFYKITRLISLTGTGARIDGDEPNFMDKLLNAAVVRVDPNRIHDGIDHLALIRSSGLDYTVVRVLKLTGGRAGPFTLTEHGPAKLLTSRREVAQAIVQVLENNSFIAACPVIAK